MALGGVPPRSLHYRDPFPGRPTQYVLTDGSRRKGTIAPGGNHPSEGPKHPGGTLSSSASALGRDRDGVVVTDGGTSGTPTLFPPVWVWVGWAGKAVARHMAHPLQHPGHKRERGRRVKGGPLLPLRVLHAWGCPVPLSAGECSPSGQAHANHSHRWISPDGEQCPIGEPPEPGPQTPPGVPCWRRGRHWSLDAGAGYPPTTITTLPPLPPMSFI